MFLIQMRHKQIVANFVPGEYSLENALEFAQAVQSFLAISDGGFSEVTPAMIVDHLVLKSIKFSVNTDWIAMVYNGCLVRKISNSEWKVIKYPAASSGFETILDTIFSAGSESGTPLILGIVTEASMLSANPHERGREHYRLYKSIVHSMFVRLQLGVSMITAAPINVSDFVISTFEGCEQTPELLTKWGNDNLKTCKGGWREIICKTALLKADCLRIINEKCPIGGVAMEIMGAECAPPCQY